MRPTIGGAGALMFVLLTHEFAASLLVRSPTTQVMGTVLFDYYTNGSYPTVAAIALVMTVVTAVGVVVAIVLGGSDVFDKLCRRSIVTSSPTATGAPSSASAPPTSPASSGRTRADAGDAGLAGRASPTPGSRPRTSTASSAATWTPCATTTSPTRSGSRELTYWGENGPGGVAPCAMVGQAVGAIL